MPVNLFTRSALDQGAITAMRQKASTVVQDLTRGTNSVANLLYRNFRASDTTLNGNVISGHLVNPVALVANTYATDVFPNCTTKQTQAFAIFGFAVMSATPTIDEITFYVGADIVAVLPLDEVWAQGTNAKIGYIFDPVWVPPQTHLRVDLLSGAGQTISLEQFALLGYVGEKSGDTVNAQHQVVTAGA